MVPKFRVWDITNKQWATDFTLSLDGNLLCDNGTTLFVRDNFILMQWTGFQDINGIEVFDLDIIQYQKLDTNGNPDEPVFWRSSSIAYLRQDKLNWYLIEPDSHNCGQYIFNFDYKNMAVKVIGNIYQNPDLIADNSSCKEL